MGDNECVDPQATPETEPTAPREAHACLPLELCEDSGHPVARDEEQTITVAGTGEEDATRYPRYSVGRLVDGHMRIFLYQPGESPRTRFVPFTADHYRRHLAAVGRSNPDITSSGTWGEATEWELPVCRLVDDESGERRIVFDGGDAPTWNFRVYNLSTSQPGWVRFLKRTLMGFPREHLEWGRIRTVYLDFFLGTLRIGLNSRDQPPAVSSGGANWPFYHESVPERRRQVHADPDRTGVICVSYAALNREWAGRRGTRSATEEQIDAAFNNMSHQALTLYHEFGHIWHFLRPGQVPSSERARRRVIHQNQAVGGLFDQFRTGSDYSGVARSQGPTEGVAEAYRHRLQGHNLPGTPSIASQVEEVLDQAGMPTQASAAQAQSQIAAYLRTQGR